LSFMNCLLGEVTMGVSELLPWTSPCPGSCLPSGALLSRAGWGGEDDVLVMDASRSTETMDALFIEVLLLETGESVRALQLFIDCS